MNLLLLRDTEIGPGGSARVGGRRAVHVHDVLRSRPGDVLRAGVIGGRMGSATVVESSRDHLAVTVELTSSPLPPSGIDLLLAMPRPKVLRRLLQTIATLGIKRIALINASRVEKSYFDSPLAAAGRIEEELVVGLEQARDNIVPEVLVRRLFRPFVEDEAPALWPDPTVRLLAHGGATRGLESLTVGAPRSPAVLAIGPEGGWVDFEIALLEAAGFRPFTLGPRALRVDAALTAAVSQIELKRRLAERPALADRL